jgi:hypothetical protein
MSEIFYKNLFLKSKFHLEIDEQAKNMEPNPIWKYSKYFKTDIPKR